MSNTDFGVGFEFLRRAAKNRRQKDFFHKFVFTTADALAGHRAGQRVSLPALLLTPFPQQQFNATDDRRVPKPSTGVTCFDCHVNGHTNKATHLVGDIRPQEFRHRIDTPTLRGVNIQRLFGSQRALKTVEDFTEFEQRAAYFDGDLVIATKKGVNILERGSQVHFMTEFHDVQPASDLAIAISMTSGSLTTPQCRSMLMT